MEPTLKTHDILLTERFSKRINHLERGDIIVAKNPIDPKMMICKRIVGVPGDKIHIKPRINPFGNSKSNVDENLLADISPFADDNEDFDINKSKHINNQDSSMRTFRSKTIYVPNGHVWIEGDNSDNSIDSRTYGPIPIGLIQSRAFVRLYPKPVLF